MCITTELHIIKACKKILLKVFLDRYMRELESSYAIWLNSLFVLHIYSHPKHCQLTVMWYIFKHLCNCTKRHVQCWVVLCDNC